MDSSKNVNALLSGQTTLPSLPTLTSQPVVYSGCCLALSAPLLTHLRSLLPPAPNLILSIGSGYGLLEALLLLTDAPSLHIIGIEVEPSSNRYLAAANHRVVVGTRFLDPLAAEATAWLFVYSRRVGLVQEYLAAYGGYAVNTIVWVGPQADWEDYSGSFNKEWDLQVQNADEVGGRASELIAIASRNHD